MNQGWKTRIWHASENGSDERHEDFETEPVRCSACGTYSDQAKPGPRGPLCPHCVEHGEGET